jgi:hypothetical protein
MTQRNVVCMCTRSVARVERAMDLLRSKKWGVRHPEERSDEGAHGLNETIAAHDFSHGFA